MGLHTALGFSTNQLNYIKGDGHLFRIVLTWKGHLWQSRFFSSPLDLKHFLAAVRYVELNPVRAGIVAKAVDYPWSSAPIHMGHSQNSALDIDNIWHKKLPEPAHWEGFLGDDTILDFHNQLKKHHRNLPIGSEEFVTQLEKVSKASLKFRPQGRPKLKR